MPAAWSLSNSSASRSARSSSKASPLIPSSSMDGLGTSLGWVMGVIEEPNCASRNMQRREKRSSGVTLA